MHYRDSFGELFRVILPPQKTNKTKISKQKLNDLVMSATDHKKIKTMLDLDHKTANKLLTDKQRGVLQTKLTQNSVALPAGGGAAQASVPNRAFKTLCADAHVTAETAAAHTNWLVEIEKKIDLLNKRAVVLPKQQNLNAMAIVESPMYNDYWNLVGMPRSWPLPRPFYRGPGCESFAYWRAGVAPTILSVTSGQTLLVLMTPNSLRGGVAYTTGAAATNSYDWSGHECLVDYSNSLTFIAWSERRPTDYYGDTAQSAAETLGPSDGNYLPPIIQVLGGRMRIEVTTPYSTLASISHAGEADGQGRRLGRHMRPYRFPLSASLSGAVTVEDDFIGRSHAFNTQVTNTPRYFADMNHEPTIVPGSSRARVTIPCTPDSNFGFAGERNSITAADGGTGSVARGFAPRENVVYYAHRGYAVVTNNGPDAIFVKIASEYVAAQIIHPDNDLVTVSALASSAQTTAPRLKQHVREDLPKSVPLIKHVGESSNVVEIAKSLPIDPKHVSTAIENHAKAVDPSPATTHSRSWGSMISNAGKSIFNAGEELASNVWKKIKPRVEEKIEDTAVRVLF